MPSSERLKRQLLEFAILTLVTVVVWIAYGVYSVLTQPVRTNVSAEELRPLPPVLMKDQLGGFSDRIVIGDDVLEQFSLSPSETPLPVFSPTPSPASPSSLPPTP